jgi:hypothetical protein
MPPFAAVYLFRDQQHEQALAEAKRAHALGPNWYSTYYMLGATLNAMGCPEETIALAEEACVAAPGITSLSSSLIVKYRRNAY